MALRASGDGVIQSTAKSYVWISGNSVRPYNDDDLTDIDLLNNGGARILSGDAGGGNRNVMLPVTITGPMYGQAVTVTALDIYYRNANEFGGITAVLLRRQTGTCSTNCYVSILSDFSDYTCPTGTSPSGCTIHWDLTANNVLTADSGILYLTLELPFYDNVNWTEIGGARLTLAHE